MRMSKKADILWKTNKLQNLQRHRLIAYTKIEIIIIMHIRIKDGMEL